MNGYTCTQKHRVTQYNSAFLLLLSVSGIGPRHSLGLLSSLGIAGLQRAIESGDVAALSTAPGVGRRTASRVVLELKGKLEVDQEAGAPAPGSNNIEITEALTALGYSTTEARRAVNDLGSSPDMTVEEYLRFMGTIRGMSRKHIRGRIDEVVGVCRLEDYHSTHVSKLSKGFRQRVGIAQAILHEPDVLILDEPTIGIDPIQVVGSLSTIHCQGAAKNI